MNYRNKNQTPRRPYAARYLGCLLVYLALGIPTTLATTPTALSGQVVTADLTLATVQTPDAEDERDWSTGSILLLGVVGLIWMRKHISEL